MFEQEHAEAIAEDALRIRTGLVAGKPCCGSRAQWHNNSCRAIQDAHVRAFLEGITRAYSATDSEHSYAVCRARLAYRLAIRPHSTLSSLRAEYHDYVMLFSDSDPDDEAEEHDYNYAVAMRAACDLFAEEIERTVYLRALHEHRRWAIANDDGGALLDAMIAEFGLVEAQRRLTKASETGMHQARIHALAELDRRAKATLPRKQPSVCTCWGEQMPLPFRSGSAHSAGCLHRDANRKAGL